MSKIALLPLLVVLVATPSFAAVDRPTAITTLAGFYNSHDIGQLRIRQAQDDA